MSQFQFDTSIVTLNSSNQFFPTVQHFIEEIRTSADRLSSLQNPDNTDNQVEADRIKSYLNFCLDIVHSLCEQESEK